MEHVLDSLESYLPDSSPDLSGRNVSVSLVSGAKAGNNAMRVFVFRNSLSCSRHHHHSPTQTASALAQTTFGRMISSADVKHLHLINVPQRSTGDSQAARTVHPCFSVKMLAASSSCRTCCTWTGFNEPVVGYKDTALHSIFLVCSTHVHSNHVGSIDIHGCQVQCHRHHGRQLSDFFVRSILS